MEVLEQHRSKERRQRHDTMVYTVCYGSVILDNMLKYVATRVYSMSLTLILERSGSVEECLTRDREAAGSSLTRVTALWSLSKTHLS